MTTKLSVVHGISRRISGLWLAATCICIVMSLSLVSGGVSAAEVGRPQSAALPSMPSAGTGDIRQEPIVEVEVDVRDESDVTLLQSLGYACGVGLCKLELREGEELALSQLGLTVRVTARAIKLSAGSASPGAGSIGAGDAPDGEWYAYGENWTNDDIPDCGLPCLGGGFPLLTYLTVTGAPPYATVSRLRYSARFVHTHVGDLYVLLFDPDSEGIVIWDRWGHATDEYMDDDPEDDHDIDLRQRETNAFNGKIVNGEWSMWVIDKAFWNTGYVDFWYLYVYYNLPCVAPSIPEQPLPANGALDVALDATLSWIGYTASAYDVHLGIRINPPLVGTRYSDSYAPVRLLPNTHYYWKIVAKNDCGSTSGPLWDFTTQVGGTSVMIYLPVIRKQ